MSGTRDENVFMARLAEQAERYEDMVTYMTRVANIGSELSLEERNLLSVAFKNAVGARRSAWRQIANMMQKDPSGSPPPCVVDYKNKVEKELNDKCEEILQMLKKDNGLINTASNAEARVFYQKMEGDYHRYLAEFSLGDNQTRHAANAYQAYAAATEQAGALAPVHPIRLGLALNFSVFYYEVYGRAPEACQLAKAAFEAATTAESSGATEEQLRDSGAILQLLRDNLVLWENDASGAQGEGKPPEQDGTLCEDL